MMLLLFGALLADVPAHPPAPARLCTVASRVQLAYKPYGSAVFGSDGLHCATVKTDDEPAVAARKPAAAAKAKAKRR